MYVHETWSAYTRTQSLPASKRARRYLRGNASPCMYQIRMGASIIACRCSSPVLTAELLPTCTVVGHGAVCARAIALCVNVCMSGGTGGCECVHVQTKRVCVHVLVASQGARDTRLLAQSTEGESLRLRAGHQQEHRSVAVPLPPCRRPKRCAPKAPWFLCSRFFARLLAVVAAALALVLCRCVRACACTRRAGATDVSDGICRQRVVIRSGCLQFYC